MYIHIGGDRAIDEDDIIFMLPRDTVMTSYDTRRVMNGFIGSSRVTDIAGGPGETYVICGGEKNKVFLSPISSTTLLKRSK